MELACISRLIDDNVLSVFQGFKWSSCVRWRCFTRVSAGQL